MIENCDAVIFDFDGTLYDYRYMPINVILNSPLDIFHIKAERDARRKLKGVDFGSAKKFKEAYAAEVAKLSGMSLEKASDWCFSAGPANMLAALRKKYKCRVSAPSVFAKLDEQGVKTAVYSDYAFVEERMAAIGFADGTCKNLFSAEEFGALKPCRRPFLEIAAALEVEPERCLVVGDRSDTDGAGAEQAGMMFVQIVTHKTKVSDFSSGHPVIVWDDFAASVLGE